MNNIFRYKTSQGLNVIYVYKKDYNTSYCGIGCKYGGSNLKYKIDNIDYESPQGTAHFIEHQLFKMEDGSDALKLFNEMFVVDNAYTQIDKTIYYFKTTSDILPPLELLLRMYFKSHFTSEAVELEKSIIKSEMKATNDNPGFRIINKIISQTFPEDDFSNEILGTEKSVDNMTKEDLFKAHKAFYTPTNSVLCIIGNQNYNEIFSFIESKMNEYHTKNTKIIKEKTIKSIGVLPPIEIYEDVYQREIYLTLRFNNITSNDPISCEKLLILLDSLFNVTSSYYQYLNKKRLFISDIDFEVHTFTEASYALITAPSNNPDKLATEIISKIKNLTIDDLDHKIIDLNIKHLISESILDEDNPTRLGDKILSLALEDVEYESLREKIEALDISAIEKYIDEVKSSDITYLIVNPNNKMA